MKWTDDKVEELKQLWPTDLSTPQIARRLGGGCTKNAVIGKAHRLLLPNRDRAACHRAAIDLRLKKRSLQRSV